MRYDACIIGGSVAGAAVAIALAERGARVVVVERSTAPGDKACGEGVFPLGVAELRRLGVLPCLEGHARELPTLRFVAGAEIADARLGHDGVHAMGIDRLELVAALLDAAAARGVELHLGVRAGSLDWYGDRAASLATSAGRIDAGAYVAADGLGSRIRREAGLAAPRQGARYGLSAHVRTGRDLPARVEVHVGDGHELYVTPLGDRTANVAVLARRERMPRFAADGHAAFRAAARAVPAIGADACFVSGVRAAGPFPSSCMRAWRGNLVLAGDAAGFFDGISGEGISLALRTAPWCAAAVTRYLESGEPAAFAAYDRHRRALARNSELLARLTLALAPHPSVGVFAVRTLRRNPALFDRLVAVSSGERTIAGLWSPDLLPRHL